MLLLVLDIVLILPHLYVHFCRESEGVFGFANYSSEVEDLRAVVEHFAKENRPTFAIIGHSKGILSLNSELKNYYEAIETNKLPPLVV